VVGHFSKLDELPKTRQDSIADGSEFAEHFCLFGRTAAWHEWRDLTARRGLKNLTDDHHHQILC